MGLRMGLVIREHSAGAEYKERGFAMSDAYSVEVGRSKDARRRRIRDNNYSIHYSSWHFSIYTGTPSNKQSNPASPRWDYNSRY